MLRMRSPGEKIAQQSLVSSLGLLLKLMSLGVMASLLSSKMSSGGSNRLPPYNQYFPKVVPGRVSVRKGLAGSFSLLKRLG